MRNVIQWLNNNKEWIFDGIGVTIIAGLIGLIIKKKDNSSKEIYITQKGSLKSTNYQNNNIGGKDDK